MKTAECAVPVPKVEIVEQRALGRQVFRNGAPLAARAQHIQQAVDDLANIDLTSAPATLGWRDQRLHQSPFRIRQITRIAQSIALVFSTVRCRPHRCLARKESSQSQGIITDSDYATSFRTDTEFLAKPGRARRTGAGRRAGHFLGHFFSGPKHHSFASPLFSVCSVVLRTRQS